MEFEDILSTVGGFGKFQKNLAYFFFFPICVGTPFFWLSLLFMVSVPDHWCHVPQLFNYTEDDRRYLVSAADDPSCTMRDWNDTMFPVDRDQIFNTSRPCDEGWEYDRTDYDLSAGMKFNMVCDRRYYPSLVLTFQKMGNLIGLPIYGHFSDKFGRKRILMLIMLITAITEVASVLVDNFLIFVILKIIGSTGLSTCVTLIYVLSNEFVLPQKRTYMSGVINLGWTAGICLLPLVAYLSKSYVMLGIINGVFAAAFLLYWNYLPESPCWLLSQNRLEETMVIMKRIGKKNGENPDSVTLKKQIEVLGERIKQKKDETSLSSFSFLKYPRIRQTFFIVTFCVIANNVGYTGLIYNVRNLNGNEFLNFFLMSAIELPGTIFFLYLMGRLGRRWTNVFAYLMTALVCFIPLFDFPFSDVLCSMIGKFLMTGAYMVSDQQASELFPTVARTFAIGSCKTIGTAVTVFLPYIANLNDYGKAVPFLMISFVCLMASVLSLFLRETLNENLPQTLQDAEDFGKDHKFFSWNRRKMTSDPDHQIAVISSQEQIEA